VRAVRTAEIAFGDRGIPIVQDARLRECDYGALTRHPTTEIEGARASHLRVPFRGGESYQQCAARVASWLTDASAAHLGQTVVVIGHRATFYALEHLLRGVPLEQAISAPWSWRPGWTYTEKVRTFG
jgi:2,3-bisphosphoglycerate-dependent phosphoglycerate mutase